MLLLPLLVVHNLCSLVLGLMLMSFIEYSTHRWMLHKNTFIRLFPRVKKFDEVLREHSVEHHSHFYKCFNREPDLKGRLAGLFFPLGYYQLLIIFISLPMLFVDWVSAFYFTGFAIAHYVLWNHFHSAMHFDVVPNRIFRYWFHYVEYCHYLHHQHRNKNFNGLYPPIWDVLLGTCALETEEDRKVWKLIRAGKYVDRKGRTLESDLV
jgi:hypothetical protein